jgi:hypothetical protein
LRRTANHKAVVCFDAALTALRQLPESRDPMGQAIDLYFNLRTALAPLGEIERVLDCLRTAETLAEALGMRPLLAHCHLGLGTLYTT